MINQANRNTITKHLSSLIALLLLAAAVMTGQQAMATDKTVTYTISYTGTNTIVATPNVAGFDGSSAAITGPAISESSTNFALFLHDNLQVIVNLYNYGDNHRMYVSNNGITFNYAATINTCCSSYYIKHIVMKDQNGTAITVFDPSLPPQEQTNFSFDLNVDIDKLGASGAPSTVTDYHVRTANSPTTIKTITITYGESPRSYTISYTNAVNGQNGVSNTNKTSYNVTTADFTITAPSRTGYTFDGFTYTDATHPTATNATLPMTISRGEAATRKEINFNASWTANTYTVTLDNQSATTSGTTSVTATFDATMPAITVPTKTGYTFGGYYTETNGGGTQYYNADGTSAHNWDITEATTLYAQWTAHTYTVHFDANYDNNGIVISGTMDDQSFTYDQGVLNANALTRTGYTFAGWNTAANGTGTTYTNQQATPNVTPDDGATVALYAQWNVTNWTGSGDSEDDPYLIIYPSQLIKLSDDVNGGNEYSGEFLKLGNDIDMDGIAFEGIGNTNNAFTGVFDGDYKTISNLTINKPDNQKVGLFSYLNNTSSIVRNVILDGANVSGYNQVGAIVGGYRFSCTIENCLVINSSVTTAGTGSQSGIILGYRDSDAVLTNNYYRNCSFTKGGNTYTTDIGTNQGDIDGARSVHTLTLPEHITATSAETVTYNQVTYYASNVEVTLTLEQGCYITSDDVTVNGTPATENGNGTWTFTMPAEDAIVSATVMEYKITVNEGTDTNPNVPFSSQYCNQGTYSQFIIPAANLTAIQWGAIHKMTFFSNTASVSWENLEYNVYFAEVGFTTFEDGDWISGSSIIYDYHGKLVYSGEVSVSNNKMEITLITGLTANKDYMFKVRRVCGGIDGESEWSGISFNTRTKIFTTAGDWATASNWDPEGVPTIDDNVVIRANATIGSGCMARANQITFEGTPTPTLILADGGKLVCNNPVNVPVQKTIEAYSDETGQGNTDGWYFIASPISEAYTPDGEMLDNTYDLYRLNPSNTLWENFKNSQHSDFQTLANGQGYLYANSADVTLSFTGTTKPYDNSYSVPVSVGFNLVGNPYTFDAYVNQIYYRMNTTRKEVEFVNENFPIPPCESVVVEADVPGYVIFTNVEQPWQASSGNNGSLSIALTQANTRGNAVLDKALISFNEGMQLGKFYFGTQDANIYIPQNGKDYAIVNAEAQGEMPLNFKANTNGTYTITVNPEGVELDYLHLIDNMTGADVDLLTPPAFGHPLSEGEAQSGAEVGEETAAGRIPPLRGGQGESKQASYTFTAKTTDYASRFKLVFMTSEEDGPSTGSRTFAFISNGNIIVNGEGTLQIVDVMGRILVNTDATRNVSTSGLTAGVYVLRLIDGDDVKVQKIVIE